MKYFDYLYKNNDIFEVKSLNREFLRENKTHGETNFPLAQYSFYCDMEHELDCHWHEELEFLMITEGSGNFKIGMSEYKVSKGQAIFINSGEIHVGYALEESCSFEAVVFDANLLYNNDINDEVKLKYIDPILNRKIQLPIHIRGIEGWEREVINQLTLIANTQYNKCFAFEMYLKARLFDIFSIILANVKTAQVEPNENADYKKQRLKQIMEYIHLNYTKKLTLKELAAYSNMSEGHFCRFFKTMIRKSPIEYINYYRVNKAAKLLLDSSMKITDISSEVGFDNTSYFISTFKQYINHTPSEYRKLKIRS